MRKNICDKKSVPVPDPRTKQPVLVGKNVGPPGLEPETDAL